MSTGYTSGHAEICPTPKVSLQAEAKYLRVTLRCSTITVTSSVKIRLHFVTCKHHVRIRVEAGMHTPQ